MTLAQTTSLVLYARNPGENTPCPAPVGGNGPGCGTTYGDGAGDGYADGAGNSDASAPN